METQTPAVSTLPRRTFLKRTGTTLFSLTLLDLVHPLETRSADDEGCKGYYATPSDPDVSCTTNEKDSSCGKTGGTGSGGTKGDMDDNCGQQRNETGSGLTDPDGSCNLNTNQGMDGDNSCGKTSSEKGGREGDEACDNGNRANGNDTDATCVKGGTDKDELCSTTGGDTNAPVGGDEDGHCGFGSANGGNDTDRDGACSPPGDPDDTCNLNEAADGFPPQ